MAITINAFWRGDNIFTVHMRQSSRNMNFIPAKINILPLKCQHFSSAHPGKISRCKEYFINVTFPSIVPIKALNSTVAQNFISVSRLLAS